MLKASEEEIEWQAPELEVIFLQKRLLRSCAQHAS